jgi:deoxycytidylate deaminase
MMDFDWSELAFGSKRPLKDLRAIFIAAPREISDKRFTQLVKEHLPTGNILLGLAKERFIDGFDGQPQFRTLQLTPSLQKITDKVNASQSPHKIYMLHYFQRETKYILEKGGFKKALFVNGSWQYTFHNRAEYYALANNHIEYAMISPFANETEALVYDKNTAKEMQAELWPEEPLGTFNATEMLDLAGRAARQSLDYTFQTGVTLGKQIGSSDKYTFMAHSCNEVVPFQSYALHYGAERERHFSPVNDLNFYDTVHAEVMMIIEVQKRKLDLAGTTLFINLLPCPHCARMFTKTDIAEFVYSEDHSDGYAVQMLEAAGKKVRRIVPPRAAL